MTGPNEREDKIMNFKTMENTIVVYFEDGSIEVFYTKDLLISLNAGRID